METKENPLTGWDHQIPAREVVSNESVEDGLPEVEWVWCIESYVPTRLCVSANHQSHVGFVMMFHSEQEAMDDKKYAMWRPTARPGAPIKMSVASALQQAAEQGPCPSGYPCVGVKNMSTGELIYTDKKK